jgi:hypothetical protein
MKSFFCGQASDFMGSQAGDACSLWRSKRAWKLDQPPRSIAPCFLASASLG